VSSDCPCVERLLCLRTNCEQTGSGSRQPGSPTNTTTNRPTHGHASTAHHVAHFQCDLDLLRKTMIWRTTNRFLGPMQTRTWVGRRLSLVYCPLYVFDAISSASYELDVCPVYLFICLPRIVCGYSDKVVGPASGKARDRAHSIHGIAEYTMNDELWFASCTPAGLTKAPARGPSMYGTGGTAVGAYDQR
jgi:hypothetical protein